MARTRGWLSPNKKVIFEFAPNPLRVIEPRPEATTPFSRKDCPRAGNARSWTETKIAESLLCLNQVDSPGRSGAGYRHRDWLVTFRKARRPGICELAGGKKSLILDRTVDYRPRERAFNTLNFFHRRNSLAKPWDAANHESRKPSVYSPSL